MQTPYILDLNAGLTQVLDDGTSAYVYGLDLISQQTGINEEYPLRDALGSIRQVTEQSSAITGYKSYQPYGEMLSSSGEEHTPYGFAGEWTDASGLQHLRARYYEPSMGRFVSRDSWEGDYDQPISYNKWLYSYANPVNLTDPTGFDPGDGIAGEITKKIEECYNIGDLRCVWLGYWEIASGGSVVMPHASNHLFRFFFSQGNIYYYPPSEASGHWTSDWVKNSQTVG